MSYKKVDKEMIDELYSLIASVETAEDCKALFEDLCTANEIEQMAQRVRAAKLLTAGKTYNQVTEETDISSATLSRVSRCVHYGSGYRKFLTKS
ncbi:MAG: YerC/YecD family TrpR-related protein [Clostridiales bacterium]|nr:YerC/YecD family TrpR-related protein [Clostridiales bacterium]MCD7826980.1 YerC/YecD family TrpR-related protein [Clostridiales bacterium]